MFRWLPGISIACRYRAYKTAERVKRKRAGESRSYVQALALRGAESFFRATLNIADRRFRGLGANPVPECIKAYGTEKEGVAGDFKFRVLRELENA